MSDIRWGWLLGSAAVGAALGLLLSSGDARRNPYNGRKKRKARKNPMEFEDFGLDPYSEDFEEELDKKKAELKDSYSEALVFEGKKTRGDLLDIPEFRNWKEAKDELVEEEKKTREIDKKKIARFNKLLDDAMTTAGDLGFTQTQRFNKYLVNDEKKKQWLYTDDTYNRLDAESKDQFEKEKEARAKVKRLEKEWEDYQKLAPNVIATYPEKLEELERLEYEFRDQQDEDDRHEHQRSKLYAKKSAKDLAKVGSHQTSHMPKPKRRVRNNK